MSDLFQISPSTQEEQDLVDHALGEFNINQVPLTQNPRTIPMSFVVKNVDDEIIGGINAEMYMWKMLYIHILWVHEHYRGKDLGSRLIQTVENEAKKHGCTLAHLDTFDFQAKDFYLKQGFEIFGVLEDCPPGHKRYYMKKKYA